MVHRWLFCLNHENQLNIQSHTRHIIISLFVQVFFRARAYYSGNYSDETHLHLVYKYHFSAQIRQRGTEPTETVEKVEARGVERTEREHQEWEAELVDSERGRDSKKGKSRDEKYEKHWPSSSYQTVIGKLRASSRKRQFSASMML